jgi:hypothetical protein
MAVIIQHIIAMSERYCFISNDIHHSVINPCLGYDWNKKAMLNIIKIHINHRIQNQFFLKIIFNIEIMICTSNTQNDINNHTGYTPSNFVKALLSVNARIAKILSVGVPITESHNVKNIQNMIREFANEKNSMSIQIFLFSVLFMLVKNIHKQIRAAMSNPTK